MASKDLLILLSVLPKKSGLIANEFLSVICQFLYVGIIDLGLEFYFSHFGNKTINGFSNRICFLCCFVQFVLSLQHGRCSHFNATFCRSQRIASILLGSRLLVKLVRSLVCLDILVNCIFPSTLLPNLGGSSHRSLADIPLSCAHGRGSSLMRSFLS